MSDGRRRVWPRAAAGVACAAMACAAMACGAVSCGPPPPRIMPPGASPEIRAALEAAGGNGGELVAVLEHYRQRADSLQLRAAEFLIANMEEHGFTRFVLRDSTGGDVPLDVLAHPDYDALIAELDSLEAQLGTLDFVRQEQVSDLDVIRADLLIEHIDLAFAAWQQKPWARHLSFVDFCAYVLPYRGSEEPLERWRGFFLDRFADLPARMADPSDPVEAARWINDDLRQWFRFDPRFYLHPTDQGLSEMLTHRLGRCEDMTNLTIYAMRANGLGVTSDYTPYWPDAGNNHAWNAILDREGRVVMFMGAEAQPGEYRLSNRVAKVYRKTFAQQPGNLAFQTRAHEAVPRWLGGKSYLDVTADYTDVTDVALDLAVAPPDTVRFAYLCVFNDGEWRAIQWGRIDARTEPGASGERRIHATVFGGMGRDIAYLPAYYLARQLVPAGPPFILEADGRLRSREPRTEEPTSFAVLSTTRRELETSTDGVQLAFLEEGREYELFYWDGAWVSAGRAAAAGEPLRFQGVPANALYWMTAKDSRKDERIFTVEDGRQVWW